MDSDEVVQLYLLHDAVAGAALKELRGFQRIHLARGQSKTVTFDLRGRDLSIVDAEGKRRIVQGPVRAWIGGGQPATTEAAADRTGAAGVSTQFKITSETTLPE
jgi:beta-glucosidase